MFSFCFGFDSALKTIDAQIAGSPVLDVLYNVLRYGVLRNILVCLLTYLLSPVLYSRLLATPVASAVESNTGSKNVTTAYQLPVRCLQRKEADRRAILFVNFCEFLRIVS